IAITGEIRSGKDTVAEGISNVFVQVKKLYFAEEIERIIRIYFLEAFEGNKKPRKYYQKIGQFMRSINPEVWVNQVDEKYRYLQSIGVTDFICTDLRQFNEYEWLKSEGFLVIKVEAD